jgi:catechol 2,3-dioxygenase-like lactoylglutathione lyase family enzyme
MRMERSEPILPARSLDETRTFYEKLGFTPWSRGRGEWEYVIVSRGHLVVHFFAEPGLTPGVNETSCYWRVKDADRFYQEWAALKLPSEGIPRLTAPLDQPWGMREFTLVDPSGNLVRVGHDLNADTAYVPQDSQVRRS